MSLDEHPRFSELSNGQQILARKIVKAGLAEPDDVVMAFVDRLNGKIGRWKQSIEHAGLGEPSGAAVDPQKSLTGRTGVAASPWNYGQGYGYGGR